MFQDKITLILVMESPKIRMKNNSVLTFYQDLFFLFASFSDFEFRFLEFELVPEHSGSSKMSKFCLLIKSSLLSSLVSEDDESIADLLQNVLWLDGWKIIEKNFEKFAVFRIQRLRIRVWDWCSGGCRLAHPDTHWQVYDSTPHCKVRSVHAISTMAEMNRLSFLYRNFYHYAVFSELCAATCEQIYSKKCSCSKLAFLSVTTW